VVAQAGDRAVRCGDDLTADGGEVVAEGTVRRRAVPDLGDIAAEHCLAHDGSSSSSGVICPPFAGAADFGSRRTSVPGGIGNRPRGRRRRVGMAYVGINVAQARQLGRTVADASEAVEQARARILPALLHADLDSAAPTLLDRVRQDLATVHDLVATSAERVDGFGDAELNAPSPPNSTLLTPSPDGLAGLFNRPPVSAVPGAAIAEAPAGWPAFMSPYAGERFDVAILGDSFFSGEGLPGDAYKGLASDGIVVVNPAHQAADAGPLQAVRALQLEYPEAEVRITYTTDPSRVEVIPPLVPTFGGGPVITATFAAESGADTGELLGRTSDNFPFGPYHSQISNVTAETDAVLLSIGGNNRINDTDANGGFVSVLRNAMGVLDVPYVTTGADEIDALTNGLPRALEPVKEVVGTISERAAPWAEVIYTGYPYFISPLDENRVPLPLPDGLLFPLSALDENALGFPTSMIDDMENQASARFWTMMTLLQENYAESVPLKPGQNLEFVHQDWDLHTLLSEQPAVNGYLGSGDPRSFHPNELGQQLYRDALEPPLLDAASRIMGPPLPDALSPFDSLGIAAGADPFDPVAGFDPGPVVRGSPAEFILDNYPAFETAAQTAEYGYGAGDLTGAADAWDVELYEGDFWAE
jgi:hypothetical protein